MTKILFHIGHHKTGSTALQCYLAKYRSRLEPQGICYPRTRGWGYAHHALFPHFFGVEHCDPYILRRVGSSPSQALEVSRAAWNKLRESVALRKPEKLVLSSESFFTAGHTAQMERLGRILREVSDEIEVVSYVRNPAELLLASLSTQIQIDSDFQWPPLGLRKDVLLAYEHVNPSELHVVKYSKGDLVGGDITQDFCSRFLGNAPGYWSSKNVNASLSAEAMIVMENYVTRHETSRMKPMPLRQQVFRRLLARADRFLVSGYKKAELLPGVEVQILDACTDLDWLEDRFNIKWVSQPENQQRESPDFAYFGDLSVAGICSFDPGRLKKIEKIMSYLNN